MRKICLAVALLAALVGLRVSHATAAPGDITLLGKFTIPNSVFVSDVWGYVDPNTLKEYAVVGDWFADRVYIIDATDPQNMILTATVSNVPGFDVKVWSHYVYTCDGDAGGIDSRVIDISDPRNPVLGTIAFPSAHNIAVSPGGLLAAEFPGVRLYDLNPNPLVPTELWNDAGEGHDATIVGDRLYDFRGFLGTHVWDISTPSSPSLLELITDASVVYHHSGDITGDGQYLWVNDELASDPTPDVTIWDMNVSPPVKVRSLSDPSATIHNAYIIDDFAFVAHYSSGFKVVDMSNPPAASVLDEFDTNALTGEGFEGAFGVYPYAPGGKIYVSDIDNGLHVFAVEGFTYTPSAVAPAAKATLDQNVPNPFNPSTTITYQIDRPGTIRLDIYDARGRHILTLAEGVASAGVQSVSWNGTDRNGRTVASGVYFYQLRTAETTLTKRMVLLK